MISASFCFFGERSPGPPAGTFAAQLSSRMSPTKSIMLLPATGVGPGLTRTFANHVGFGDTTHLRFALAELYDRLHSTLCFSIPHLMKRVLSFGAGSVITFIAAGNGRSGSTPRISP